MSALQRFMDEHITPALAGKGYAFRVSRGPVTSVSKTQRLVLGFELHSNALTLRAHALTLRGVDAQGGFHRFHGALVALVERRPERGGQDLFELPIDWAAAKVWHPGIYWRGSGRTMLFVQQPDFWKPALTRAYEEIQIRHAALALGAEMP